MLWHDNRDGLSQEYKHVLGQYSIYMSCSYSCEAIASGNVSLPYQRVLLNIDLI